MITTTIAAKETGFEARRFCSKKVQRAELR